MTLNSHELLESDYSLFKEFLASECGIVLGDNKQYLVRSRLLPLLRQFEMNSYADLIQQVVKLRDSRLNNAVVDAMTTNETLWFRDGHPFEVLKSDIFPILCNKRSPVRIWCAACSSGQEPYSIAMSLIEYREQNAGAFSAGVEIIGTDISNSMLEQSKLACYDNLSLSRGLSIERLERFFQPSSIGFKNESRQLKKEVTDMVSFRSMNLFDSYTALGSFDLIFCRNVLIYFSVDGKKRILQQIASSLQSGGTLFLGASESLSGISTDFDMNRSGKGIFYVKKQ